MENHAEFIVSMAKLCPEFDKWCPEKDKVNIISYTKKWIEWCKLKDKQTLIEMQPLEAQTGQIFIKFVNRKILNL